MKDLLSQGSGDQRKTKILIAILFSLFAIVAAATDIVYVPLSGSTFIDLTIAAVVFGSMIGGYWVAIPLALSWSLVSYYHLEYQYLTWPLWAMMVTKLAFTISLVWVYGLVRKIYERSPLNVYRAIFVAVLIRNLVALPFDIFYEKSDWVLLRGQQVVIEMAICMVAMGLLIKHLRQIHILNGVKKKGEASGN